MNIEKIAIFRALFLGDMLMTVPAFRALRQRFPKAEITLIGLPWAAAFLEHIDGAIDRLVEFQGYPGIAEVPVDAVRTQRFLAEQQAYGYDLALQLHGDGTISNGFVAALNARISLGFARPDDKRLSLSLPYSDEANEVMRWLDLLAVLGITNSDPTLSFSISAAGHARAAILLAPLYARPMPLIGLHAGAKDPARRWPLERFAALGDALHAIFGAQIVLTAAEHERDLTAAVRARMQAPVLDLTGRTDLDTLAAVLSRLDLLVSNDTGASHMAAAIRTPSVVLFGPTHPTRFAPLDRERHRVVDAVALAQIGVDLHHALAHLPVESVLQACQHQLVARPLNRLFERSLGSV